MFMLVFYGVLAVLLAAITARLVLAVVRFIRLPRAGKKQLAPGPLAPASAGGGLPPTSRCPTSTGTSGPQEGPVRHVGQGRTGCARRRPGCGSRGPGSMPLSSASRPGCG